MKPYFNKDIFGYYVIIGLDFGYNCDPGKTKVETKTNLLRKLKEEIRRIEEQISLVDDLEES